MRVWSASLREVKNVTNSDVGNWDLARIGHSVGRRQHTRWRRTAVRLGDAKVLLVRLLCSGNTAASRSWVLAKWSVTIIHSAFNTAELLQHGAATHKRQLWWLRSCMRRFYWGWRWVFSEPNVSSHVNWNDLPMVCCISRYTWIVEMECLLRL